MNSAIEPRATLITTPDDLHAFEPGATRARFLDQRMRLRLAESLRYILAQANGQLEVPQDRFDSFLSQLEHERVSPLAFSFYSDAVLAIEEDDLDGAARWLREMILLQAPSERTEVRELRNPLEDPISARYARFIDSDPSIHFDIFPPPPLAAAAVRALIQDAFSLMDQGDPNLAAEIRALLREIILAAGTDDPKALTFDGASAFMLWGAVIINVNRRADPLVIVQMLAHESAHNLLFGFSADGPLVENDPEELFPSPLRADPRPMDGIYHATYVTARMHRAVKRLHESGVLSASSKEQACRELEENVRLFDRGIQTVREHGRLTRIGAEVMDGAVAYMSGM